MAENIWATLRDLLRGRDSPVPSRTALATVSPERLEEVRRRNAGRLNRQQVSVYAQYLDHVEGAARSADAGDFAPMARIARYVMSDGHLAGLLKARSAGIARLPATFKCVDNSISSTLSNGFVTGSQDRDPESLFETCVPASELAAFELDAYLHEIAIAELVWSRNSDVPKFTHHSLESLSYDYYSNAYYFMTPEGRTLVEPGLGRWVLYLGTEISPHQRAPWRAICENSIRKQLAQLNSDSYCNKTANPARVGEAPPGASDIESTEYLEQLISWGVDSCFVLPKGWTCRLVESTGTTHNIFKDVVEACNTETQLIVCGSTIPAVGGQGFSSTTIHELVRGDLIASAAQDLAQVINSQILPAIIVGRWGAEVLERTPVSMQFDARPPASKASEAQAMISAAQAVSQLKQIYGQSLDLLELASRFGVPLVDPTKGAQQLQLVPEVSYAE